MLLWARLEIQQVGETLQKNYRCNITVEGCEQLRKAFRRKLILGSTPLCEDHNDLHVRQQRLHASLSANCGTVYYPIYRVMELFESEGYNWICCPAAPDREVHMFVKTISENK